MRRRINQEGLQIIKDSEGCRLLAYQCPSKVWTVGWGHTGPDVKPGMRITQDAADLLLLRDIELAQAAVQRTCPMCITDNQFSALVSLVYNIGTGNFLKSEVHKNIVINDIQAAADHFLDHVYARGNPEPLRGLVIRREREKELFLS